MTPTTQQVIAASHRAYDEYAKQHTVPVPQKAIEAWHETYRRELEADYEATIADFEASYGRR